MAANPARPMTVREFRSLPEPAGEFGYELHHGELVLVTRPKYKHYTIQRRLRQLLEKLAPADGLVDTDFAYRALPEHELRVADVAYITGARERAIDPEDNLLGAPNLTIEILSPSNTVAEIYDKEKLCLENGAQQFWIVDPDRRQVKISTPDGQTITWHSGIPLPLFGNASLTVDAIFE